MYRCAGKRRNDLSATCHRLQQMPTEAHHGWKYVAFGPDGKLYIPVGAPCNNCESKDSIFTTITRLDVDKPGARPEILATGIRNSVGFDWHPVTGELWFTENGRDMMGDDVPPCELNRLTKTGQHFGYPYCHGGGRSLPILNLVKSILARILRRRFKTWGRTWLRWG